MLLLDEPTRGVDVGAKAEIDRIISHLAAEGIAVMLISDDAQEVIGMADRILVFRGGRIVAETGRASFDREAMLLSAAQAARDEDNRATAPPSPAGTKWSVVGSGGLLEKLFRIWEVGLRFALVFIGLGVVLR